MTRELRYVDLVAAHLREAYGLTPRRTAAVLLRQREVLANGERWGSHPDYTADQIAAAEKIMAARGHKPVSADELQDWILRRHAGRMASEAEK